MKEAHPDAELVVTGHSLGGALATMASADLVLNRKMAKVRAVTFGSPRVFNKKGAMEVSKSVETWRIVAEVPFLTHCMLPVLRVVYTLLHKD